MYMTTRHYSPLNATPARAQGVTPQQECGGKEGSRLWAGCLTLLRLSQTHILFVRRMISNVEHALHARHFRSMDLPLPFLMKVTISVPYE